MSNLKVKTITMILIAIFMTSMFAITSVSAKEPTSTVYFNETIPVSSSESYLRLTVVDDGTWVTWTFDFPVENFTGDGNLNVGLIIALDGEGEGPAFQIHNNDGTTTEFPVGTWLMSPWGPTITDGWMGWHSGDTNTEVSTLSWVEVSGNRNVPHEDGVMTIRISRAKLGYNFHWAASPTVGSGFYAPMYDVTMQVPTDFGWNTPLVNMTVPNYEQIQIPVPPKPKPRNRDGIVLHDGVNAGEMWKTPHKLIVVDFPDGQESSYILMITIMTQDGETAYNRTLIVSPRYEYLALFLHASVFPPDYVVVVSSTIGDLPYLVASREGIERSG